MKQELSYDPWGRLRDPNTQQVYAVGAEPVLFLARGYTGHEYLTVFGLINMNARLYDPALGRFLSPDPYVQSPDFSQNFNRYSYCLNNPLRYSDPTGLLTWNDVIAGVAIVAGVVLDIVGLPAIGTSLIVAGFSHFANTIDQMQNSNMNWNQASNNAGFQFSTTIDINGPTAKEKNHSNSSNNAIGVDASNSDHDINLYHNELNHYKDQQNGLNITFGRGLDDLGRGGVEMQLVYYSDENMSNSYFTQTITTNYPGERAFSFLTIRKGDMYTYFDNGHSGPNSTWYYPPNEMKAHIYDGGYRVEFTDFPRRPLNTQPYTYWNANLSLINNGKPVFTINYGFTINYMNIKPIYFTLKFYP